MATTALKYYFHLRKARSWSRDAISSEQSRNLRLLLAHAKQNVPYYAERLSGLDPESIRQPADLTRIPLLSKADVKANFPDRIVAKGLDTRSLYSVATSGSSDRVMLFQDETRRDWDRAADLLLCNGVGIPWPSRRQMLIPADACYERCGVDEHGRSDSVSSRLHELWSAGKGRRRAAARKLASIVMRDYVWQTSVLKNLGVEGTALSAERIDEYLDQIRDAKVHLLQALPMYLFILARRGRPINRPLARWVRPAGGKLTPRMSAVVESAFGAKLRENYGAAELGTIAFDCPHSITQHHLSSISIVEFIRAGRPVGPGELGELIITDLRNYAAPLIRYRVGDVGSYETGACRCGFRGLRFIVQSRMEETVVTRAGRAFAMDQLIDFFLTWPEVKFVRLVQTTADQFMAEVVPFDENAALPDEERVSQAFSEFLGQPSRVRWRKVRRVAPERSGKYKLVESVTHNTFHTTASDAVGSNLSGESEIGASASTATSASNLVSRHGNGGAV